MGTSNQKKPTFDLYVAILVVVASLAAFSGFAAVGLTVYGTERGDPSAWPHLQPVIEKLELSFAATLGGLLGLLGGRRASS